MARLFDRWRDDLRLVARAVLRRNPEAVMAAAHQLSFTEDEKIERYGEASPSPIPDMIDAWARGDVDTVMEHASLLAKVLWEIGELPSVN